MISFREYLTEEKNTHMTHIEDAVIYGGVNGTRQAIMALRSLRDMLKGNHEGSISVKWDGAPAIFAGTDPRDGKFFVAKKGIFNKNPKVYKTNADIDADTSGDLNNKLKLALKYLPGLGIKGIIQGDFLYGPGDVKKETIKGDSYITFHPNTILYAIPSDSSSAKDILSSKLGIVWHTTYNGSSFETMKASYGVNVAGLNKNKNVWSQDAFLRDLTKATLTKNETKEIQSMLSDAGVLFNQIAGNTLRQLESNQTLAQHIETFNNTYVRKGQIITDTNRHVNNLIKWIRQKYAKEAATKKTSRGRATQLTKRNELLKFFSPENKTNLKKIFDLQLLIVSVKLKLINKLNSLGNEKTFVKTNTGYKVVGKEGFVAIDTLGGGALKIVDRMEFSYNNFSPNVLKGWDKPGRK